MTATIIACAQPLAWPSAKPRTPRGDRLPGRFRRGSDDYHRRDMTLHEARVRVAEAVDAFTPSGQTWVIDPAACEIRSMVPVGARGGFLSGRSRPDDPGAMLLYPWRGRPSRMPIDRYQSVEQNLCAIAACLDALRTIDRHDGATLDEAMSGFALPATVDGGWRAVLGLEAGADRGEAQAAWRAIASRTHPDSGTAPDAEGFRIAAEAWRQARAELGA